MKYLWTEDTGAGLHFWKLVNQLFLDNEFVVASKGNNQGLLDQGAGQRGGRKDAFSPFGKQCADGEKRSIYRD